MDRYKLNTLKKLFIPWIPNCTIHIKLKDLKLDSRYIESGDLFIAIKGFNTNGELYINEAISKGAVAILVESKKKFFLLKKKNVYNFTPIIYFYKLNQYLSNIAGRFYGYPSLFLKLVGVTGTNGKTTITHLLANWVELLGEKSAVMGTLGNGILDNIQPSVCTTASAIDTQKILTNFINKNIRFVAMEVSSHGLDQYRVDALYFDVAIFSNLSRDHLDYHHDIKDYKLAKWRLFNELHVENYIINIDDDVGYQWLLCLPTAVAVTMRNVLPKFWSGRWICLVKVNYNLYGTEIFFRSSWGNGIIYSQLLGMLNVSNLLLTLGALLVMGYSLESLLSCASFLKPVCGRLEVLRAYNYPTIIIDYAHTPDAFAKVLIFIKSFCKGKIWSIFGCGGDRDRGKRAVMGYIAEQYSNYIIITNDNPRTENPEFIIKDIVCKIKNSKKIQIIQNRVHAINSAIAQAKSEDFIIVFGKGHETYQILENDCVVSSDQNIVKNFFNKSSFVCKRTL